MVGHHQRGEAGPRVEQPAVTLATNHVTTFTNEWPCLPEEDEQPVWPQGRGAADTKGGIGHPSTLQPSNGHFTC